MAMGAAARTGILAALMAFAVAQTLAQNTTAVQPNICSACSKYNAAIMEILQTCTDSECINIQMDRCVGDGYVGGGYGYWGYGYEEWSTACGNECECWAMHACCASQCNDEKQDAIDCLKENQCTSTMQSPLYNVPPAYSAMKVQELLDAVGCRQENSGFQHWDAVIIWSIFGCTVCLMLGMCAKERVGPFAPRGAALDDYYAYPSG